SRGTDDDARAGFVEFLDDVGHRLAVMIRALIAQWLIAAVVHAVAGRGDRWFEPQHVIFHPREKSPRGLPAPAELHPAHVQIRPAHQQIIFNENRILFLLGDGIAADGENVVLLDERVARETNRRDANQECEKESLHGLSLRNWNTNEHESKRINT